MSGRLSLLFHELDNQCIQFEFSSNLIPNIVKYVSEILNNWEYLPLTILCSILRTAVDAEIGHIFRSHALLFGWLLSVFSLIRYFSLRNRKPGTLCMQSSSLNMVNYCIDMLLVPLARPCFWSLRMPSVSEMLVRSNKTLRTPHTLGDWLCCEMEYRGNSVCWELRSGSPCKPLLFVT